MKSKITPIENAPLKLESDTQCLHKDGTLLETSNPAFLCRCGLSKSKPFCDGTHRSEGFDSSRQISEENLQEYPGKDITVHFNRSICSGAAECVHNLPSVFKSESKDWIHPDQADADQIMATIKKCPSGALTYTVNGEEHRNEAKPERIDVVKDGPFLVKGIELVDESRPTRSSKSVYALCRCGKSKNKPFCDYSHAEEGWSDE